MIRMAVLCPSEIAYRRFLPALIKNNNFVYVGVGVCSVEERFGKNAESNKHIEEVINRQYQKAEMFVKDFGGRIFKKYQDVVEAQDVDAVYVPLPPALHFEWARTALINGKHVLIEKPSTISLSQTAELVNLAESKDLALHENYMFAFHKQIAEIAEYIREGNIGTPRLYRITFGFPYRGSQDFRYNKSLGGGALFDCGGYTIKYAQMLLKGKVKILYSNLNYEKGCDVDISGSAALSDEEGMVVQVAFGMDNDYRCELEVWGSTGTLKTGRVLTAPAGFKPNLQVIKNNNIESRDLSADDAFANSIEYFYQCIKRKDIRKESLYRIYEQSKLVENFRKMAEGRDLI